MLPLLLFLLKKLLHLSSAIVPAVLLAPSRCLLMTVQLWLLTLAFDLYLGGQRSETVVAAVISGLVFLGGLAMLRVVDRGPRRRR